MPAIDINSTFLTMDADKEAGFSGYPYYPDLDIDSYISGIGKNLLIEGIRGTGKNPHSKDDYRNVLIFSPQK